MGIPPSVCWTTHWPLWRSVLGAALAAGCFAAGCSSPSLRYQGRTPHQTEVDGRRIDIYARPGEKAGTVEVQAILLAGTLGLTREEIAGAVTVAILEAAAGTGCRLAPRTLEGGASVWEARLDC